MIINPYNKHSKGAKELRGWLNAKGVRTLILARPPRQQAAQIICWGNKVAEYDYDRFRCVLNRPAATLPFTNKLKFFGQAFNPDHLYTPAWTMTQALAQKMVDDGETIVERHSLTGSSGEGIRIKEPGDRLEPAPLYVKYERKTHEYRLHIFRDAGGEFTVRRIQRKVRKEGAEIKDWKIRNLDNGFIFQAEAECPDIVRRTALELVGTKFPTIDFVALDLIYHDGKAKKKEDASPEKAFVLEGNTAPGLCGDTIAVYGQYFKERFNV